MQAANPRGLLVCGALLAACRPAPAPLPPPPLTPSAALVPEPAPALPAVPAVRGPLAIRVIYPGANSIVDARDSSFMFGSVGTGAATLTINGDTVPVWPNGAWLAWLPLPPDSLMRFTLVARAGGDSLALVHEARRPRRFIPTGRLWIDSASASPAGRVWWPAGEYLPVSVRAAEGASVRIRFPGGAVVPLAPDPAYDEVSWGIRAFDRDTLNLDRPLRADRYTGAIRGAALGFDPGPLLGPGPGACITRPCLAAAPPIPPAGVIEAILGPDTVRVGWPIQLALLDTTLQLVRLDDDTAGRGDTDNLTVGRALPGGTYHWFFPAGTRARATGRIDDQLRLRLSAASEAWVAAADAVPLPAGLAPLRAVVGSATLTPGEDRLLLRIPLSQRVPFQVSETDRTITVRFYSAVGDVNWIRYGGTDPYVRAVAWAQDRDDEVTLTLTLAGPLWGFRTRWSATDLMLEIRRPPVIDAGAPLRGRRIMVDPGHPPAGATGPSGYREAEANLAVSLELARLLEAEGAVVLLTRTADVPVNLNARTALADSLDAEVLVSIHNNALPDGVNPFTNNGTSVYYNHPRSIPLAAAVQRRLVSRLGLRDLGIGRGDLALVRPTWMPAILAEGLFMMLPDQEAALRQPEGQRLYARAVLEGLADFLRERALP